MNNPLQSAKTKYTNSKAGIQYGQSYDHGQTLTMTLYMIRNTRSFSTSMGFGRSGEKSYQRRMSILDWVKHLKQGDAIPWAH